MKLNLKKDLVVFDLETTGLSVSKDKIVQIAIVKIFADGRPSIERCRLINPGIPIPAETSAIHGIFDIDVENEPKFEEVANGLIQLIGDADFLTFNGNRFDIPFLMEEFARAGKTFDMTNRKTIDALRFFHKMEKRNLEAAVQFYLNKKHEKAHDAMADAKATLNVLEAQLDKYKNTDYEDKGVITKTPIKNDIDALHEFCVDPNDVDYQGKIKLKDGVAVFEFGKFQGKPVGKSLAADPKYFEWILAGDFATDTKNHIRRLVQEFQHA